MKQLTIHLASTAPLQLYPDQQLRLPALEMLCSRGHAQPFSARGECSIFEAIGLSHTPYAQQRLAGEERPPENPDSGYWYCADPVHLRADRDQVILTHPDAIEIHDDEADALIAAFNGLFAAEGMALWRSTSTTHWYLRTEAPWKISTTPLGFVAQRSIREQMPQGEDAQRWRKVVAELEMLFHAHPVNQRRSQGGRPMINSLWLWGMQQEQRANGPRWDLLVGGHLLLKGVSRLQGIERLDAFTPLTQLLDYPGNGLMIIDDLLRYQRSGAHQEIPKLLEGLEQQLFIPALQAMREGRLDRLTIQPANGMIYRLKRWHLLRLWRRTKPIWPTIGS